MQIVSNEWSVSTRPGQLHEITADVSSWVDRQRITEGQCTLWLRHTSAGLLVCENADPDVLYDLKTFYRDLVPDGDDRFVHTAEGPDDMPAHVRSVMTGCQLTIPVLDGRLQLGTWQGVFVWEFRAHAHERRVVASLIGR